MTPRPSLLLQFLPASLSCDRERPFWVLTHGGGSREGWGSSLSVRWLHFASVRRFVPSLGGSLSMRSAAHSFVFVSRQGSTSLSSTARDQNVCERGLSTIIVIAFPISQSTAVEMSSN